MMWKHRAKSYVAAVAAVGLASVARFLLDPFFPAGVPFITFFFAVMVAAWYGGLGPALVAAVLSTLAADYLFIVPVGQFKVTPSYAVVLGIFALEAVGIAFLSGQMHEAKRRAVAETHNREQLLNSISDAFVALDDRWRYIVVNPRAAEILGKPKEELLGRSMWDVFPDMVGTELWRESHEARRTKNRRSLEFFSESRQRWYEKRLYPSEEGLSIFFTDMTEQKQAREALRESEHRFRLMADAAPVLIWSAGMDKLFDYFNKGWLDFTGRAIEQELGNGWAEGVHPDDFDRCLQTYVDSFDKREPFQMEYRLRRFDGEYRWILDRSVPRFGPDGIFMGYIGSCIDITDLKLAQEAVRESEQRLGGIISSAMDAIITIDEGQRITDFNSAAERMFGCAASDAIGEPIDRFIPKRFRAAHAHHIEVFGHTQVTRRQMGALGTIYGRRADGTEFPIEASISQLRTKAGKFYTVILRDITEQARQVEALRNSEARYRELIHALSAAVYTCDQKGRITLYNQAAAALWGQEPEVGKDLWCGSWKIYRPDGTPLPLDECPMAVTLREGRAVRGEEIIIERPDGVRRHVLPHPEPMRNAAGAVVGAVNMLVDITELKQAEQAIANLAAIVTSSDDAIIGKDLRGIVTSWNRAAERLFGYSADDMIGQSVTRLIPPDRRDEEHGILARLARGEAIDHYETIRRRKDGTDIHVSLTVSPVVDSQGRIIGASKIARDITEQKRAEEALLERDRALTAANEALSRQTAALAEANTELESFSYSVSHDLRAPLRTIDAFSRIVLEDHGSQLDAEALRCLNIVRKAAGQAGELIDDLLELSRLGRQSMHIQSVKTADLVIEAANDLRIMQEGRRIDLIVGELPPCRGDRRLLKLAWTNLLANAFKYTKYRPEARVEVGWMPDDVRDDMSVYYVKDNGVGFDMKYVQKLFGVFQRLHRKEDFEGTGVGLAIVQRIVHRHGGRVWAEGKVDGGATFYVSLRKG